MTFGPSLMLTLLQNSSALIPRPGRCKFGSMKCYSCARQKCSSCCETIPRHCWVQIDSHRAEFSRAGDGLPKLQRLAHNRSDIDVAWADHSLLDPHRSLRRQQPRPLAWSLYHSDLTTS